MSKTIIHPACTEPGCPFASRVRIGERRFCGNHLPEAQAAVYALLAQNRDLLAALELAGHTAVCSNDSELTPTAKEGRGLCERCAAIATTKGATK